MIIATLTGPIIQKKINNKLSMKINLVLLCFIALNAMGQDSISHFNCKGKESEIHKLLKGHWVNVNDSNEKITITSKSITIVSKIAASFVKLSKRQYDTNTHEYYLAFEDSTQNLHIDVDIGKWQGYCMMSGNGFFAQISSVSKKYLRVDEIYLYRRK
jgi:hypothetical protein